MKIGVLSFFTPNINGHGGEKRSYQIRKLFNDVVFIELFHFKEPINLWQRLILCMPTILSMRIILDNSRVGFSKTFIRDIRRINSFIIGNKKYLKNLDLVVWESNSHDNYFIPYVLKNYFNIRVFAFPHNLETLVYNNQEKQGLNLFVDLKLELTALKLCERVFVISREENWLLKLLYIDSIYLPFYLENNFKKSYNNGLKNILVIGSFNNPPTGAGMFEIIEYFRDNIELFNEMDLHVIGFGTEVFRHFESDRIHIYGGVSNFDEILLKIDIILINQMPSSGALTKIIEFSKMGFKIICNVDSKRSYFDFENVFEFNQLNEIPLIIKEINKFELKKNGIDRVLKDIQYAMEKIKN